jgi:arylsulfatase A
MSCRAIFLGLALVLSIPEQTLSAEGLPNMVMIYADDLGYGDMHANNPSRSRIPTPNMDRLCREGMRFTDAHSSSGVCSPSRYTLLTGRYHWRTRLQSGIVDLWGAPLIAAGRLTLPGMLKQRGYRTGCVGKWHLGWDWPLADGERVLLNGAKNDRATPRQREVWGRLFSQPIPGGPVTRGFDVYFGTDVPNWPPFCFIEQDRTVGIPSEFLPEPLFAKNQATRQGPALAGWTLEPILPAVGRRAVEFVLESALSDAPYFLYLPLTAPHTPLAVSAEFQGRSGLGVYADFVLETDAWIGRVLDAVDQTGERDRTLVVFTSDNGFAPGSGADELERAGHYPSGGLRGYKADVWEGGHRVPFVVRWPGVVRPGSVSGALVHQADLMATCAAVIGYALPPDAGEDSVNLLPLWQGEVGSVRSHAISQSSGGLLSVREGDWKFIPGRGSGGWAKGGDHQPAQLFNLSTDPGEEDNLYVSESMRVEKMTALLRSLVESGRSTPGPAQANDVPVRWNRIE